MSPTEIASFGKRPEKTIAMHFFNPVHKMPLVEIVRGLETSDETVEMIKKVAVNMGKETVVINEFPGFVTSRISALVGNEAFYMLQEGLGTPEEIDKAIKLGLNYPMGPFELVDLVGLDTRLNNLNYLHGKLGEEVPSRASFGTICQSGASRTEEWERYLRLYNWRRVS